MDVRDLVNKDTARLLKGIGYPQNAHDTAGYIYDKHGVLNVVEPIHREINSKDIAVAPTQSQAVRFIRENYHLYITTRSVSHNGDTWFVADVERLDKCRISLNVINGSMAIVPDNFKSITNPEVALEHGICAACEMILKN